MGWRPLLCLLSCIVYALITRNITWQRVSPEPPVPAQMNDSLSIEEGGSEANDGSTSDQGGRGVVDELDEGLARLNDLDLTGVRSGRVFGGARPAGTFRRRCR